MNSFLITPRPCIHKKMLCNACVETLTTAMSDTGEQNVRPEEDIWHDDYDDYIEPPEAPQHVWRDAVVSIDCCSRFLESKLNRKENRHEEDKGLHWKYGLDGKVMHEVLGCGDYGFAKIDAKIDQYGLVTVDNQPVILVKEIEKCYKKFPTNSNNPDHWTVYVSAMPKENYDGKGDDEGVLYNRVLCVRGQLVTMCHLTIWIKTESDYEADLGGDGGGDCPIKGVICGKIHTNNPT